MAKRLSIWGLAVTAVCVLLYADISRRVDRIAEQAVQPLPAEVTVVTVRPTN